MRTCAEKILFASIQSEDIPANVKRGSNVRMGSAIVRVRW